MIPSLPQILRDWLKITNFNKWHVSVSEGYFVCIPDPSYHIRYLRITDDRVYDNYDHKKYPEGMIDFGVIYASDPNFFDQLRDMLTRAEAECVHNHNESMAKFNNDPLFQKLVKS